MVKRILTSIVGIAVFAAVIFTHCYLLYAAVALIIFGMLHEMYGVMSLDKSARVVGFLSAAAVILGCIFRKQLFGTVTACMIAFMSIVPLHGKVKSDKLLSGVFAGILMSVMMCYIIMIRRRFDVYTVILPFVCAWFTDTGAYFTGSLIGKHKLAPNISPKKTVEGAVGGTLLSCLGCAAYILVIVYCKTQAFPRADVTAKFVLLGFIGSLLAQLGDLAASCIKRDFEKKDYGSILPGHGGLLDRFDSVLLAAPFVYYAMLHFIL